MRQHPNALSGVDSSKIHSPHPQMPKWITKWIYLSTRIICQRQAAKSNSLDPAELEMSSSSCCQTASIFVCFLRPRLEELSFVHSVIHAEVLIECLWHARHSSRLWRSCSGKKKMIKISTDRISILVRWRPMISRAYGMLRAREKKKQGRGLRSVGEEWLFLNIYLTLFIWLLRVLVGACRIFDLHCSMQGL